jgi:ABC-type transporter Mla subunit MlaD
MPSPSERRRNNIRAGVFVTVTLVLGLIVLIMLTDAIHAMSRRTETYIVTFDVSSGVNNLKPGSEVRVGGVVMGKVKSIKPKLQEGEAFRQIAVQFNVDHRIKLYRDAQILVSAPLIGSDAWLEIPNVGHPVAGAPPGNELAGTPSLGFLTSLLGSENADKASQIVDNAVAFSEVLPDVRKLYEDRLAPMVENLNATTADIRAVVGEIRQTQWPAWAHAVNAVMTWATSATAKLDAAIAEGQGVLSDSRAMLAENRQPIRQTLANVETATNSINTETIAKVHKLLDAGQEGLDQAVRALENMRVDYASWATNIGEALANANLAAQQLKLTTIETRRSPWKLLYRPSPDELEHELLYEAARSFALAAADLKAAADSVQRVLREHGDEVSNNEDAYRRLQKTLLNSLENYEKAQQQLLDVLVSDSKARK